MDGEARAKRESKDNVRAKLQGARQALTAAPLPPKFKQPLHDLADVVEGLHLRLAAIERDGEKDGEG